ncbi:MAG TPA: hypothetical protein PKW55_02640 [Spirochaetota bacterium]|nr:hypothetical protein [Spirochaetota bacterium]
MVLKHLEINGTKLKLSKHEILLELIEEENKEVKNKLLFFPLVILDKYLIKFVRGGYHIDLPKKTFTLQTINNNQVY